MSHHRSDYHKASDFGVCFVARFIHEAHHRSLRTVRAISTTTGAFWFGPQYLEDLIPRINLRKVISISRDVILFHI